MNMKIYQDPFIAEVIQKVTSALNELRESHPDKPELQVKWFLDQAEAVKKQRLARGESVTDQKQYGDWVADIERPAAQYRGRYQLRLDEARQLLGKA